jgi:hypothetical protein
MGKDTILFAEINLLLDSALAMSFKQARTG